VSLRRRMVLLTTAAVAFAVVLSAVAGYIAVDDSLRGRVDRQLKELAGVVKGVASFADVGSARALRGVTPPKGGPRELVKAGLGTRGDAAVFTTTGQIYKSPGDQTRFTLLRADLAVAAQTAPAHFRNTHIGATPVRLYIAPAGRGRAVIAAQSLKDLQETLHRLAVILAAIAIAGVALAVFLGLAVARAAARPVHDLRRAAEHVRSTGDLSRRIRVNGSDDLGRLGESFNSMLASLAQSQLAQGQLLADASHELRTPIATLRTNLEVLARNPEMELSERIPLLRDLAAESAELGVLADDLLVSARSEQELASPELLSLDELTISEVERCRSMHSNSRITVDLQRWLVSGSETGLRRAIANVLDNAVKWSPSDGAIEVTLIEGALVVRDHGPGFREEDLPRVFDRFYRSETARTVPGSGLGLSIVEKVAREHSGTVIAANAPGGGAIVTLTLPPVPPA